MPTTPTTTWEFSAICIQLTQLDSASLSPREGERVDEPQHTEGTLAAHARASARSDGHEEITQCRRVPIVRERHGIGSAAGCRYLPECLSPAIEIGNLESTGLKHDRCMLK